MKRIERVYCELLIKTVFKETGIFTQKQLAKDCIVSLGLVNYALTPPFQIWGSSKKNNEVLPSSIQKSFFSTGHPFDHYKTKLFIPPTIPKAYEKSKP